MAEHRIKDICNSNARSVKGLNKDIEIQYLETSDLTCGECSNLQPILLKNAPSRAQRLLSSDTIVYSMVRPNLCHYGYFENPPQNLVVSTGFLTLNLKPQYIGIIDPHFVYLLLTQPWLTQYLHTIAQNAVSSYPSLNPSDVECLCFEFPDFEIQRRFADLFFKIDRKIALNREINRNLEAMARQLYDYWFVQFDFPDDNDCPYKSSGGNMVWNDRLKREIPQGWNVDNILSICEIKVGGTPSKFNNTYWDNGSIPFFGPTDVSDNIFQLDTVDHITHEGLEHCASSLFQVGDIILTARGSIGKMVIVGEPMAMNQSCYALSPKFQNTTYLYFLSKELIEWLKAKGNGSVFKSFNVQDVEYSQLCIAPTQIIERFCNSVNCLFSQIRENTKEIATLIAQRKELLPLLMNGQVSIMPQEVNCDLSHD